MMHVVEIVEVVVVVARKYKISSFYYSDNKILPCVLFLKKKPANAGFFFYKHKLKKFRRNMYCFTGHIFAEFFYLTIHRQIVYTMYRYFDTYRRNYHEYFHKRI